MLVMGVALQLVPVSELVGGGPAGMRAAGVEAAGEWGDAR